VNDHQRKLARKAGTACGYRDGGPARGYAGGGKVSDALDDELNDLAPLPKSAAEQKLEGAQHRLEASRNATKMTGGRAKVNAHYLRAKRNEADMAAERAAEEEEQPSSPLRKHPYLQEI
jgi:hypothetical protein